MPSIGMKVSLSEIDTMKDKIKRYAGKLEDNSCESMERLARWVQKSAKLRAPRWTGNLANNIKFVKLNKKSFNIESTAINPATGKGYARKMELGGYTEVVPFRYSIGGAIQNVGEVTRIQLWARAKYPSLLTNKNIDYIKARNYKPHIRPAFRKGIEKINEELRLAHEKSK